MSDRWRCLLKVVLIGYLTTSLACSVLGGDAETRARKAYVEAVKLRFSGDSATYYSELIRIANSYPTTRAGRKARVMLDGNSFLVEVITLGVFLSWAWPPGRDLVNYLQSSNSLKLATALEVEQILQDIYDAQKVYYQQYGRYCPAFSICGAELGAKVDRARYLYFLNDKEIAGGAGITDLPAFRQKARKLLKMTGIVPRQSEKNFLIVGIGPGDQQEEELDLWTINGQGEIKHVVP